LLQRDKHHLQKNAPLTLHASRFTLHVSTFQRFNASTLQRFTLQRFPHSPYRPRVPERYDIIIAGLGAMGSAAAFHLARRGARVLGLDRFTPPHGFGSSHGQTRIIREAYFEHPIYVPIVRRAYVVGEELAAAAGVELFRQTGGLMIGAPDSALVRGAKLSADTHGLAHEMLSAAELHRRFPALCPADDMQAVLEPRAGVLFPERCVAAHLQLARRHGAGVQTETSSPAEAYAAFSHWRLGRPDGWAALPWA